ncbi:Presilphiperfolan-8-beta-ol synthase [Colletotrichum gloeosporioides]|uniref:Terpene synthase n=1 Tax=Colletotrichum gloeosporioides TaxID=474922 RepID=A0A8H4CUD7_COLGL|nr:Presilphiperfolan-8-beta-ol synthase [Colletotrichum gloeosporioides]KAF3809982.1 Presilphiperfolan-8-beta-ol synthase [Colletotrichum gloeosporioides]
MSSDDRYRVSCKRASTDMDPSSNDVVPSKRIMLGRRPSITTASDISPSESSSPPATPVSEYQATATQTSPSDHGSAACDRNLRDIMAADAQYVRIPDCFSSIMSVEPAMNVNWERLKEEANAWIKDIYHLSDAQAKKHSRANFAFMNAMWIPYADEESFRVMLDWNNWVFAFDDQFDEGHLKDDPVKAQKELDAHMAILEDKNPPVQRDDNPIHYVFQTTWDRFKKRTSPELQARYRASMKGYFEGLIGQVKVQESQKALKISVKQYMDFRRATIACEPCYALVEYAHGISISQEQIDHESVQTCMQTASDLVILVNDILSYRKDLEQGVDHNLISLLKAQGYSTQAAVDKIGDMIDECYKRWYGAMARMPLWGEKIDREVLRYLDGCRNIALGNLHWSYESGRYLGAEGAEVRQTRIMRLPSPGV